MDFRFTQDQQDLIDAAKTVFDGENTVERMRAMVAGEEVEDLWPKFAELGLIGVMAPVELGGLGQGLEVMAGIAEAAGYSGLSDPLVETAGIVVPTLKGENLFKEIEEVISGKIKLGIYDFHRLQHVSNVEQYDGFVYSDSNGSRILGTAEAEFESRSSIDPLRKISRPTLPSKSSPSTFFNGTVLSAAQLVGLSKRMMDMSVAYAKERHQFGKPIGSFQAIKHQLANAYTQIEFTRPMILLAAKNSGIPAYSGRLSEHIAKISAIDTAMLAGEVAIQIHGGMGYTFEVDLHLYMKRAWALCGEWGDRNYHMRVLENIILESDIDFEAGLGFPISALKYQLSLNK